MLFLILAALKGSRSVVISPDALTSTVPTNRVVATPTPQPEQAHEIPDRLKNVVRNPWEYPSFSSLSALVPEDRTVLVEFYRKQTNLWQLRALTAALGFVGNDEVSNMLIETLTRDYYGIRLTSGYPESTDEESVLVDTVHALGFLAHHSDPAYSFVKQGADQEFWKQRISWSSGRGRETVGALVSASIQAVGQSGRADVPQFLQQLKEKDMVNRTGDNDNLSRVWTGDVIDAAFFDHLIRTRGYTNFRSILFSEERHSLWRIWIRTDEGQRWLEWSKAVESKR
jgi:hypothetical protein